MVVKQSKFIVPQYRDLVTKNIPKVRFKVRFRLKLCSKDSYEDILEDNRVYKAYVRR